MRKTIRKITIEGSIYRWTVKTSYVAKESKMGKYETHVRFAAYLEGYRATPLVIKFLTWENPISGNPLTSSGADLANLNKPSMTRKLILYGLSKGWKPAIKGGHLIIENGIAVLSEIGIDTREIEI